MTGASTVRTPALAHYRAEFPVFRAVVWRLGEAGIVADGRPGHLRLSPYFYNTFEDNAAAIETLTS